MARSSAARIQMEGASSHRDAFLEKISCDLVVCGGGLAGVCAAISAARAGISVTLIQDRPVLGGNASSEVRLWALGATSHMGNNNRWAREGGLIDEILVENLHRNPDGNPLIFDTVLLEKAIAEPLLRLLLNTAIFVATKDPAHPDRIRGVEAFCSQNGTRYAVEADLFVDATGDGILGFLAGAAFRMGAESSDEFGEGFAPTEEYGYLLGHSIYFMSKDVGHPVSYTAPSFAIKDVEKVIPRFRDFAVDHQACQFWWIEYGGNFDTIAQSEDIKWELWRIVYGVWDYIKNSGKFPDAANLTLEWVGHVPGKRESRRFEGDAMLIQQDVIEQRRHDDAISFGGWALDLHPADGVHSAKPGCDQWHSKGIYQIPYRTLYSRNVENLFLGGRLMSASHVAFGSSRVMLTCAHNGAVVGQAAALCKELDCSPRAVLTDDHLATLRTRLQRTGHYIPHVPLTDPDDLARSVTLSVSSELVWDGFPADGPDLPLDAARALMFPCPEGKIPSLTVQVSATETTRLTVELRASDREGNFTPDVTLETLTFDLTETPPAAPQTIRIEFDVANSKAQYLFVCFRANPAISIQGSHRRLTGILTLANSANKRVAKKSSQTPDPALGIDAFEFWIPERRPGGHNLAIALDPPLAIYESDNLINGWERPVFQTNAWVADPADSNPTLTLEWDQPQTIARIVLAFDTDFDHAMETVIQRHPENRMPFCVQRITIFDDRGIVLARIEDNHHTYRTVTFDQPVEIRQLVITLAHPSEQIPAALFAVRCYGPNQTT